MFYEFVEGVELCLIGSAQKIKLTQRPKLFRKGRVVLSPFAFFNLLKIGDFKPLVWLSWPLLTRWLKFFPVRGLFFGLLGARLQFFGSQYSLCHFPDINFRINWLSVISC